MHKEALPGAGWAYVVRHRELGLLGRLVLHGLPSGHCQVSCEVAGDPADPQTARRRAVLEPITTALVRRLDAVPGTPWGTPPPSPPPPGRRVASKLIQCARCDAGVALLIFADDATDLGGLEDYARLMDPQIRAMHLPTWVIGPPRGPEPLSEQPTDILKVWPTREPVRRLRPAAFTAVLDALAQAHCSQEDAPCPPAAGPSR
jgi:hypothetical protein